MGTAFSLRGWLAEQNESVRNTIAIVAAFATYFCMYAFRKPFTAATFDQLSVGWFGGELGQKTLFVVSQVIGYATSKYLGVRFCSETSRRSRLPMLIGLIAAAEVALVLFALAPESSPALKALAIFANGLPLGMVWGLMVMYLEGRRLSEVLLTGLSCSYIVASGVVKDVGRAVLDGGPFPIPFLDSLGASVPNPFGAFGDFAMPAVVGGLFFVPFLLFAWVLDSLPDPSTADEDARVRRVPMNKEDRSAFLTKYAVAIVTSLSVYFVLTAYRDYRDIYTVETFAQLGYDYEGNESVVSRVELLVAFGVMAILSQLYIFKNNRVGLAATHAVMSGGLILIGAATALLDLGVVNGFWWMTLVGLGGYLCYVPFGAVLFDRAIACTRFAGTAVFGIYLADAIGYTGSAALMIGKDFLAGDTPHLAVLRGVGYAISLVGPVLLGVSCTAFLRKTDAVEARSTAES